MIKLKSRKEIETGFKVLVGLMQIAKTCTETARAATCSHHASLCRRILRAGVSQTCCLCARVIRWADMNIGRMVLENLQAVYQYKLVILR